MDWGAIGSFTATLGFGILIGSAIGYYTAQKENESND